MTEDKSVEADTSHRGHQAPSHFQVSPVHHSCGHMGQQQIGGDLYSLHTAEMRPYENPWPYNVKTVFNKYLGNGRSNQKISKNEVQFFSNFGLGWPPPHPVNWSPTHSTGPQTPFLTDISVMVTRIKKFQKTRCIYF